ncbi:tRNA(Ile)-lysidine synthase [Metamycoplasma alkalescens 14918]|uniref:tRNA(Ile)-lysidine synthase n=2 Tax=Metamycoplasma alkalescens TaxID=45363 RepID=N9UAW1_9BACT|nr:tRNA(Ile)-lysidine synthase [Metamycoplasma alkalescens 14918]
MTNKMMQQINSKFFNEFANKNITLDKPFILGISGGPDSMWLLNLMKNQNIIVACVNYNKRADSWVDQKVVEDFCKEHNIKYELLILDQCEQEKKGNFQKVARDERYCFYKKIYDKYQASCLLLAHHKDDLLETYLFQKQSKRKPGNVGISILNNILGMKIFRPMINLWYKDEILEFCKNFQIPYAIDCTNLLPIYTRNKIRIELAKCKTNQKDCLINEIHQLNKDLNKKNQIVESIYLDFEKSNFNYKKLDLNHCYINEILFEYLHRNLGDIKISKNKLIGFKKFILSQKNFKSFIINKNLAIFKKNKLLKIIKIDKK